MAWSFQLRTFGAGPLGEPAGTGTAMGALLPPGGAPSGACGAGTRGGRASLPGFDCRLCSPGGLAVAVGASATAVGAGEGVSTGPSGPLSMTSEPRGSDGSPCFSSFATGIGAGTNAGAVGGGATTATAPGVGPGPGDGGKGTVGGNRSLAGAGGALTGALAVGTAGMGVAVEGTVTFAGCSCCWARAFWVFSSSSHLRCSSSGESLLICATAAGGAGVALLAAKAGGNAGNVGTAGPGTTAGGVVTSLV
jgi:hypothetical protein